MRVKAFVGLICLYLVINCSLYAGVNEHALIQTEHFQGGSGSFEDPFLIQTAEHLYNIRYYLGEEHSDKHYLQTADIDLGVTPWNEGEGWETIGSISGSFHGLYDGGGYIIDNLFINGDEMPTGLFGHIMEAVISNLGIVNADVTGVNYVGGLVGWAGLSIISNCYITGDITGVDWVGGLAGDIRHGTEISNSYSIVNVHGNSRVGGLSGINFGDDSLIANSYSDGTVSGKYRIGGLVGQHSINASIINCYSTASVDAWDSVVGGLVGRCYEAKIVSSYSRGVVSGNEAAGGLVGSKEIIYDFLDENNYWDVETSGQISSAMGSGRTTAEMTYPYTGNTYENWDFDEIWEADEDHSANYGYPFLRGSFVSVEDEMVVFDDGFSVRNYPNPFNPSTTIRFLLAEAGQVKIDIFNIRGQRIKSLANDHYNIGVYDIIWDGTDDSGQSVTSGMYFYRTITPQGEQTNKMLLLK